MHYLWIFSDLIKISGSLERADISMETMISNAAIGWRGGKTAM